MVENERSRLTSWKEIAAYLGREVRTVIRWEKERQLPVHRVPGGKGRSVFAYPHELDSWALGEHLAEGEPTTPEGPRRPRGAILVAAAMLVIAGAGVMGLAARAFRPGTVTAAVIQGNDLVATTDGGRELWRYRLPGLSDDQQVAVQDLDGDGRRDTVVAVDVRQPGGGGHGALLALDHTGQLRWERTLPESLTFGAGVFSAPWQPDRVLVYASGGEQYVAWATHHHTWWPGVLAVFDRGGRPVGRFVNAGWIRSLQATSDGRFLIAGGVSNARNGAAFAVLDARQPSGSSPEDAGSPFACRDCPDGRPIRYVVMPWSDVATIDSPDQRKGVVITYPSGTIEMRAVQQGSADLIAELSADFDLVRRAPSDAFWEAHRRLERQGHITHDAARCPYRDGPIVDEWTPERGWQRRTNRGR